MMKQLSHPEIKSESKVFPITVFADHLRTPENIGMLFRVCEAFGIEKIFLHENSPSSQSISVKRASRSTNQKVNYQIYSNPVNALSDLKASGYFILALEITNNSIPIQSLKMKNTQKTVLVIGAERHGISEEILNCCDEVTHIPMYGGNSSMNVINSLSIALFSLTNRLL
jgi:23S rRNA (guanosine2251-2'-O)-methyltransferase